MLPVSVQAQHFTTETPCNYTRIYVHWYIVWYNTEYIKPWHMRFVCDISRFSWYLALVTLSHADESDSITFTLFFYLLWFKLVNLLTNPWVWIVCSLQNEMLARSYICMLKIVVKNRLFYKKSVVPLSKIMINYYICHVYETLEDPLATYWPNSTLETLLRGV